MTTQSTLDDVRAVLTSSLQLGDRGARLAETTPLLGSLPELDSMAVVHVLTALEEHFGFTVHDDEVSAEIFESVGTLAAFVERKLAS